MDDRVNHLSFICRTGDCQRAPFGSVSTRQAPPLLTRSGGLLLCALMLMYPATSAAQDDSATGGSARQDRVASQADADQIAEWVTQLGSTNFGDRERARTALAAQGVRAFDLLYAARNDSDIEVRMSARDLLRRIEVNWIEEGDPAEIKTILAGYSTQTTADRRTRIDRLSQTDGLSATVALARIARFERSEQLSKRAAIRLLEQSTRLEEVSTDAIEEQLMAACGSSQRTAIDWIRLFVDGIETPLATTDDWSAMIAAEFAGLREQTGEADTGRELLRDLIRWHADRLYENGFIDEGHQAVEPALKLVDGSADQMLETVDWLMQRDAWELIDELIKRYPQTFQSNALLLYHVAEAESQSGDGARAEQLAQRASAVIAREGKPRLEVAVHLLERGFMRWAEREFRGAIEYSELGSVPDVDARVILAQQLYELQRFQEAADILEDLVAAVDDNPEIEQVVRRKRDPAQLKSRMNLYVARDLMSQSQLDAAADRLKLANEADPLDADVLIAMHQFPDPPPQWGEAVDKRLQTAIGHFRDQIQFYERQFAQMEDGRGRQIAAGAVAAYNNQFAWLLANTERNLPEANRCALRALELRPNEASFLDTMARCQFAQGNLSQAVQMQRRAIEMRPHSPGMKRRMEEYEAALARQQQ